MKKTIIFILLSLMCVPSSFAQVKVNSPHADLDVKVLSCTKSGDGVKIELEMINYGTSASIHFYQGGMYSDAPENIAYDDEGFAYKSISARSIDENNKGSYGKGVQFATNTPVRMMISIGGIKSIATKLLRIDIGVDSNGLGIGDGAFLKLYNVEWTKE